MRDEGKLASVKSYRDLTVWQKAMQLAAAVYRLTSEMPKQEEYRISAQMIRASTSVPANIAEGNGRGTRKDYAHFISIARGSLFELETFVLAGPAPRAGRSRTMRRNPRPHRRSQPHAYDIAGPTLPSNLIPQTSSLFNPPTVS